MSLARRREIFFEAFTSRKITGTSGMQTPLAIFVKKLQESLTRMEQFEVVTVAQSADGTPILLSHGTIISDENSNQNRSEALLRS